MIFLTVGTQEPFDRLVQAMDAYCAEHPGLEVFGQISEGGTYGPASFEAQPWVTPEEFEGRALAAEVIVSHAGMGTILTALGLGKPLVILPRRFDLGEHRNDHQRATAERFQGRQGIFVAADTDDFPAALDAAMGSQTSALPSIGAYAEDRLITALRAELGLATPQVDDPGDG